MNLSDEQKTALAMLRVDFPEHQISQLPKPTKKRDEMEKLPKATCKVCGGYHATSNVIHLSYVGHAALTDRLLDADPSWSWEPLASDAAGLPLIDKDGGMWIKLTVAGVTRLGYGDAQGKTGGDAMKERIGDALRNAAMRFGAALDLWHKGDLHLDPDADPEADKRKQAAKEKGQQSEPVPELVEPSTARLDLYNELGQIYHGNADEMADALRTYSEFDGKDGKKFLTIANLEHPSANEKMHKWFASTLKKLVADSNRG
jgi:hypothetical protein